MSNTDRRTFLKRTGLAAVTVAVPPWVWGCAAPPPAPAETPEPSSPAPQEPAAAAEAEPPSDSAAAKNDAWEQKAAELEAAGVLTAAQPGEWAQKAGGHLPQVAFAPGSGTVEVTTKHPMAPEHYITVHYVRDQDGTVIGMHEFQGTDPAATSSFSLPTGTTQITVFSHCNKHGDWSGEPSPATPA